MSRIAAVDDDPDMIALYEDCLSDHHEVVSYSSGAAVLAGIASSGAECVLVDIDLGDMNGVTVLRALRAMEALRGVPILAVTTHSRQSERAVYLNEGFDDYIAKPVNPELLLATVETALRGECMPFLDDEQEIQSDD